MKRIPKYTLLLILLLTLSFILSGKAYAKTCSDYSFDSCPKDSNCIKDSKLKKCYSCDELNGYYPPKLGVPWAAIISVKELVKFDIDLAKFNLTLSHNKALCSTNDKCMWQSKYIFPFDMGLCVTKPTKRITDNDFIINDRKNFKCSDVKHLTSIWMFLRIISPFLVVLFGSLDFFKAMASSDEKKMKESRGKFIKRVIAFILLIFLPFMLQFIFERIGTNGSQNMCLIKCITTNNTSSKEGCD